MLNLYWVQGATYLVTHSTLLQCYRVVQSGTYPGQEMLMWLLSFSDSCSAFLCSSSSRWCLSSSNLCCSACRRFSSSCLCFSSSNQAEECRLEEERRRYAGQQKLEEERRNREEGEHRQAKQRALEEQRLHLLHVNVPLPPSAFLGLGTYCSVAFCSIVVL